MQTSGGKICYVTCLGVLLRGEICVRVALFRVMILI